MKAENAGVDQKLFDYIANSLENTPYYNLLGIKLVRLGQGMSELAVEVRNEHTNPLGFVHGGLIMSLADGAMGNAVRSRGITGVTVDCSTALVSAVQVGESVTARGQVLKAGKTMVFAEANVWAGDRLLASAKGTFYRTGDIHLY